MSNALLALVFFALVGTPSTGAVAAEAAARAPAIAVPILVYHRFGATPTDSMTVTTPVFASHLATLREAGYTVIPLGQLVAFLLGQGPPPPPRSLVITIDDGHRSVYSEAFPLIRKFRVPVTLFLYPSAISRASYALTWEQVREMRQSGLCEVQSHSFWHPNFNQDRRRMTAIEFERSADMQLRTSKARLEQELGQQVEMLAWPFGIHDPWLQNKATAAGYRAAFALERRPVVEGDNLMALPRFLILDSDRTEALKRILTQRLFPGKGSSPP